MKMNRTGCPGVFVVLLQTAHLQALAAGQPFFFLFQLITKKSMNLADASKCRLINKT
jgi:hypothetical protein